MARRAPAVERSIAILNHLAAHPTERYTLSEIARDLDLNKATLHAILAALTEAGYLVRDAERKGYGLGPALIALGNSAVETHPAVHVALPEMQALTDELGLECVASAAMRDEIVILARAGTPRPFGVHVQPGQRIALAPPLGSIFVAWSDGHEIDRWLGKLTKEALLRSRRAVGAVREQGWSVGLEPAAARPVRTVEESVRGLRDDYALIELDESASYRLTHIGAPVFGPDGRVSLALFLIGFRGPVTGADVPRLAGRLVDAASRITEAIGGRRPPGAEASVSARGGRRGRARAPARARS